jgi:hypothetical protein
VYSIGDKDSYLGITRFALLERTCMIGHPKLDPEKCRATYESSSMNLDNVLRERYSTETSSSIRRFTQSFVSERRKQFSNLQASQQLKTIEGNALKAEVWAIA